MDLRYNITITTVELQKSFLFLLLHTHISYTYFLRFICILLEAIFTVLSHTKDLNLLAYVLKHENISIPVMHYVFLL